MTRRLVLAACTALILATGALTADTKPKSVIHVIAVKWKPEATPAKIDQAIKAAEALPAQYSGITQV